MTDVLSDYLDIYNRYPADAFTMQGTAKSTAS